MEIDVLTLHNLVRWLVIIFGVVAIVQSWRSWLQHCSWTPNDDRIGLVYSMVLDVQVLLGLILYILPGEYIYLAFGNIGSAFQNAVVRFFAFEHITLMLIAVAIVHIARSASHKAIDPLVKFRRLAVWLAVSMLIILVAIPWPFIPDYGRPLFRFFGLL